MAIVNKTRKNPMTASEALEFISDLVTALYGDDQSDRIQESVLAYFGNMSATQFKRKADNAWARLHQVCNDGVAE